MKSIIQTILFFALGAACGAAVIWFALLKPAGQGAAMIYSNALEGTASTALELRLGQQEKVLKDFEASLPDYVRAVHGFGDYNYTRQALGKVKAYYSFTGASVPAEIAGILAALPPSNPVASLNRGDKEKSTLTKVGDVSPVLTVQTIDDRQIDFRGKVTVLNLFTTWCGPCMEEMPVLEKKLQEAFRGKPLLVVAVGREHSESELQVFQKLKQFTFDFVADPKKEIYDKFATEYIPRCVLVGKDGVIKFQTIGASPEELSALINAVKAELDK